MTDALVYAGTAAQMLGMREEVVIVLGMMGIFEIVWLPSEGMRPAVTARSLESWLAGLSGTKTAQDAMTLHLAIGGIAA